MPSDKSDGIGEEGHTSASTSHITIGFREYTVAVSTSDCLTGWTSSKQAIQLWDMANAHWPLFQVRLQLELSAMQGRRSSMSSGDLWPEPTRTDQVFTHSNL